MTDLVNHPPHYNQGDIECIQAIKAALGSEGFKAYCKGQVFKYLWRAEHKHGDPILDLGKADWYMRRLLLEAEARLTTRSPHRLSWWSSGAMKMAMRLKLLLGGIKSWPPKPHAGGSDQELEACCEWLRWQNLVTHCALIPSLLAARRPKPPSLKAQALQALAELAAECYGNTDKPDTIRRALEQLDD